MDLFDGFKRNIFSLCADASAFQELQFLSPRERLKVFRKHPKISQKILTIQFQKSFF